MAVIDLADKAAQQDPLGIFVSKFKDSCGPDKNVFESLAEILPKYVRAHLYDGGNLEAARHNLDMVTAYCRAAAEINHEMESKPVD